MAFEIVEVMLLGFDTLLGIETPVVAQLVICLN